MPISICRPDVWEYSPVTVAESIDGEMFTSKYMKGIICSLALPKSYEKICNYILEECEKPRRNCDLKYNVEKLFQDDYLMINGNRQRTGLHMDLYGMMAVLIYLPLVAEEEAMTIKYWIFVDKGDDTIKLLEWLEKRKYNLEDEHNLKLNDWFIFQLETGVQVKIFAQPAGSVVIVRPGLVHQVVSTGYGISVAHNMLNDECIDKFISANEDLCLPSSNVWKEMFGAEYFATKLIESFDDDRVKEHLAKSLFQHPETTKLVKKIEDLGERLIKLFTNENCEKWGGALAVKCGRCEREIYNLIVQCEKCKIVLCTWCFGREQAAGKIHEKKRVWK